MLIVRSKENKWKGKTREKTNMAEQKTENPQTAGAKPFFIVNY
jgi:hypothetical protein